jgi:subtilase family serine protease
VSALSDPPTGAPPGESFVITDRVDNTGPGPADSSTTRYYLSADRVRGPDDRPLAESRAVPALAARASSTGTVTVAIPDGTPAGSLFLLACADDLQAVPETSEEDNCRSSAGVVQVGGPDLVATAVSDPPNTVRPGRSFVVNDSVANQGAAPAGSSTTRYYLSTDAVKDSGDRVLIGSRAVPSLAAGARSSGVATVTVPMGTPNGTYRLLTCPDDTDAVTEIDEVNNCRASAETVRIR